MSPEPISPAIIGESENFLLYGKPKTGKTFCALTLPPPIYFIGVGSSREAKTYYSKQFQDKYGKQSKPDDLRIDVGMTSQEIKDLANEAFDQDASGNGWQFNSIIIDNATPLTEMHIDVAMEISYGMKAESDKGDVSKTSKHKLETTGAVQLQQGDWGIAQGIMRRFLSDIMSAEKNVAMIAHEYEITTVGQGQTRVLSAVEPWFIGKDRTFIANKFDNVWRLTAEGGGMFAARTVAGLHPKGYSVVAGSRIGGVVKKDFDDPNLTKAIAKFRKHAEEVTP